MGSGLRVPDTTVSYFVSGEFLTGGFTQDLALVR